MAKNIQNFPLKTVGIMVIVLLSIFTGIFIFVNLNHTDSNTLVYGDYVGGLTTAGIMEAQNLWQQNNMSVKVNNYTSPNLISTALLKNEVDITTGTPETYAKLNQDGIHFKIIGEEYALLQEVIVRNDSSFKNITDLKGKSIGVLKASGTYSYFSSLVDQVYNISNVETYFKMVNGYPSVLIDSLAKGQLDAIILWQPDIAKAFTLHPEFKTLTTFQDMYKQIEGNSATIPPMVLWFASENAIQNKAVQLKQFMELQKKVVENFNTNPDMIKSAFKSYFGYDDITATNLFNQVKDKFVPYTLNDTVINTIRTDWKVFWNNGNCQYLTQDPTLLPKSVFVTL